jgi:hypothetical protein
MTTPTLTTLADFENSDSNLSYPTTGVILDSAGNLLGTAEEGGGEQRRRSLRGYENHRRLLQHSNYTG